MSDRTLAHRRILVVEDEYLMAREITSALQDEDVIVLGPVPTVKDALSLLEAAEQPDGAILDLNLGGDSALPIADVLIERRVPVIFTTGYDANAVPQRFAHVPLCEKPVDFGRVMTALHKAIAG